MATKLCCEHCAEQTKAAMRFYDNPPKIGTVERLRPTGKKDGHKKEYVCLDCGRTGWTSSKALKG